MYFKAKNGTFKRVPQVPNRFLFNDKFTTLTEGGVTVYYIAPKKGVVTAFKPGFRSTYGSLSPTPTSYDADLRPQCW